MCSAASFGVGRPVGRQDEQVGPEEREHAARLGERAVVADVHPDLDAPGLVDRERAVARVGEAIDAEERQMDLAIGRDQARRADQDAGVEQAVAVAIPGTRRSTRRRVAGILGHGEDGTPAERLGVLVAFRLSIRIRSRLARIRGRPRASRPARPTRRAGRESPGDWRRPRRSSAPSGRRRFGNDGESVITMVPR